MEIKIKGGKLKRDTSGRGARFEAINELMPKLPSNIDGQCRICGRMIMRDNTLPAGIFEGELKANVHFKCWQKNRRKAAQ